MNPTTDGIILNIDPVEGVLKSLLEWNRKIPKVLTFLKFRGRRKGAGNNLILGTVVLQLNLLPKVSWQ